MECNECNGKGRIISKVNDKEVYNNCWKCSGTGVVGTPTKR